MEETNLDIVRLLGVPDIGNFLKVILKTKNMPLYFWKKVLFPQKNRNIEQCSVFERKQLKQGRKITFIYPIATGRGKHMESMPDV